MQSRSPFIQRFHRQCTALKITGLIGTYWLLRRWRVLFITWVLAILLLSVKPQMLCRHLFSLNNGLVRKVDALWLI